MQIVKQNEKLSSSSARFVDAGEHLIINGVPYDKITNSPQPFNVIDISGSSQDTTIGNGIHPRLANISSITDGFARKSLNSSNINSLVDKLDNSIIYVFSSPLSSDPSEHGILYKLKKIKTIVYL